MVKVKEVYDVLRDAIEDGRLIPGQQLPSLRELAAQHGASVGSVRLAMEQLRHEALVESRHGKGSFVRSRTRQATVVLISEPGGHLFGDLVHAMMRSFRGRQGKRLLLEPLPRGPEEVELLRETLENLASHGQLSGVLFAGGTREDLHFLADFSQRTRLVRLIEDGLSEAVPSAAAVSDSFHGGYIGIRHLNDVGCDQILVVTHNLVGRHPLSDAFTFLDGCRAAARDTGISLHTIHHQAEADDYLPTVRALLDARPGIDGIFGQADFRVQPLVPLLADLGRPVGTHTAVLGYYDTPWATTAAPPLSSIRIHPDLIAEAAADLLDSDQAPQRRVIRPSLIVRESTLLHSA